MAYEKYTCTFICLCVYFISQAIFAQEACDSSKCPGPLAYYEALGCTPIYDSEESCCAVKYNCDHLRERSTDKCYINGQVYEIGESLKEEDALPCDIRCTCATGYDGIATFNCAVVDCFFGPVTPGCYRRGSPDACCAGEEVCPEDPADRARCEVDGKTYLDGERFEPASDPSLDCICQPGYTGMNVEPFCKQQKNYCRPELRDASDIHNNCAPVYYSSQSPATSCSVFSRCQNDNDTVVESESSTAAEDSVVPSWKTTSHTFGNLNSTCTFGNLTMQLGDELNQATDYSSVCVKCVCEVPPLPTCQRLPDSECDVTMHPPFSHSSK